MKIGFVGLEKTAAAMAGQLSKSGYDLVGFDPNSKEVFDFPVSLSVESVASAADVVIVSISNAVEFAQVLPQILGAMKPGSILIDCASNGVEQAIATADAATKVGVKTLDAPFIGGAAAAEDASLTFMVGGDPEAFRVARSLFDQMGQSASLFGAHGAGQAAKLCSNMVLGAAVSGVCEAYNLAQRFQINTGALTEVLADAGDMAAAFHAGSDGLKPEATVGLPVIPSEKLQEYVRFGQQIAEQFDATARQFGPRKFG